MSDEKKVLTVTVHPVEALSDDQISREILYMRIRYTRELEVAKEPEAETTEEDEGEESDMRTIRIKGSCRDELTVEGYGSVSVRDFAEGTKVEAQIETTQGSILWSSDEDSPMLISNGDEHWSLEFEVPTSVYVEASHRATPNSIAVLSRIGRFVLLDNRMPNFSSYRLYIAPIKSVNTLGDENPQTSALRHLLGLHEGGDITEFHSRHLESRNQTPSLMNTLGFQVMPLRADGTFSVSIDIDGDEIGWVWLLLGSEKFVGYQMDHIPTSPRKNVTIMLPPTTGAGANPPNDASTTTSAGSDNLPEGAPSESTTPPMNVDEQQLLDNPAEFTQDLGTSCTIFTAPNRIIGERKFWTVLRTDQPEVGGRSSTVISRSPVPASLPTLRATTTHVPVPVVTNPTSPTSPPVNPSWNEPVVNPNPDILNPGTATLNPPGLWNPATGMVLFNMNAAAATMAANAQPLRNVIIHPYMIWDAYIKRKTKGRVQVSEEEPIEWEGDPTIYQATTVAGGHILDWRVQWRSDGYSLGNVSHTLTLAPRQKRRIASVSWERSERARRYEDTEARDSVRQGTIRERDYSDAVSSTLSEWSKGGSKSKTTGAAGGVGFALGPIVIGGGAAHGRASSSSWQKGGRRAAANEEQRLRDAIRQYGDSIRKLESSTVTEVSQDEEAIGVSEVLFNVNYCHALTVIYYEILRHLRVDTSLGGVRECLFVPFAISPFDLDKVLKWRDLLRNGMLERRYVRALDFVDEVNMDWASSRIPAGPRSLFPVSRITGTLYIKLSIERPRDRREDEALDEYYANWIPFAYLLPFPFRRCLEILESIDAQRDNYFQREVAPTMARKWADRLKLADMQSGADIEADMTLASPYRYGQSVRIDFTAEVGDSHLTRQQLQKLVVKASIGLPPGSSADLQRLRMRYYTDHFDRGVWSDTGTGDLLDAAGNPDDKGAEPFMKLSPWEQRDLRRDIEDDVARLVTHMNANLVYYHKVIWWQMDRDELYMLLDGFYVPYGKRYEDGNWVSDVGRSLASVVEREPIAILGNTLVFRVAAGAFLGVGGHESPDALRSYYYDSQVRTDPLRVSLATDGLYAQAVIDTRCSACEEHFGSTDWVLTNKDPDLESVAGQMSTRRSAAEALTPSKLPETLIALQNAPPAPAPSGLGDVLQAVSKGDAFRDMAGLAGTQQNAMGALTQAASLATSFGSKALDLQKARTGTELAKRKLDNIEKARETGLISTEDAKKKVSDVLDEQNTGKPTTSITGEPDISNIMKKAAESSAPFEIQRVSKDGTETMRVGQTTELESATGGFTCPDCGVFIPGSNCAHTLSRLERWRDAQGCVAMCPCRYPVRAKEIRDNIFGNLEDSDRSSTTDAYIYCETNGGQGHVYFGTFDSCVRGNGLAAAGMSSVRIFNRYLTAAVSRPA